MCEMTIVTRQGDREKVLAEHASTLEVTETGIVVGTLLEEPRRIDGAVVRSIDFLHGKLTVTLKEGRP